MAVLFGETIRELRTKRKMTQKELSERLDISRPMISAYENEDRQPSHETLLKMSGIFNVSMDVLYGLNQQNRPRQYIEVTGMERSHRLLIEELVDVILTKVEGC